MASNKTIAAPNSEWTPSLASVNLKTIWAKRHLDNLEARIRDWINSNPYSIREEDNSERTLHAFIIETRTAPNDIPLIAGDYVNCLRSALDQLAWNLVHLFPETVPKSRSAARRVVFPICETESVYQEKRALFNPAIGNVLDGFQPNDRTNAFRNHPLWQIDRLWNIDKHKMVAVNGNTFSVTMLGGSDGRIEYLNDRIVVVVPCVARISSHPTYTKPRVTPQILFGEHMDEDWGLAVSDLRNAYDYITNEVIPAFAGFFP